ALLIITASVYVPWEYTFQARSISQVRNPAGYHFVFSPPDPQYHSAASGVIVDIPRLVIQYVAIIVLCVAGWLLSLEGIWLIKKSGEKKAEEKEAGKQTFVVRDGELRQID